MARQRVGDKGAIQWRDREQMAREPSHSKTASRWRGSHPTARQRADGEGTIPQHNSKQMATEPSHSETVSGQLIVRESFHGDTVGVQWMARQQEDSEGSWRSPATDSCAHKGQSL